MTYWLISYYQGLFSCIIITKPDFGSLMSYLVDFNAGEPIVNSCSLVSLFIHKHNICLSHPDDPLGNRLGDLVVIAPVRRAGDPGSNSGPSENFSHKLLIYDLSDGYSES